MALTRLGGTYRLAGRLLSAAAIASLGYALVGFSKLAGPARAREAAAPPAKGEARTRLVAAYVPLFLNPQAGRILVLGDALEAADAFRGSRWVQNVRRAKDADGLRADPGRYDVITAPDELDRRAWVAAGGRLAPRGVFCQRLRAQGMSVGRFRETLLAFAGEFPHVLLFRAGSTSDYLLIGTNDVWNYGGSAYDNAVIDESPDLRTSLSRLGLFDRPWEGGQGSRIAEPFELLAGEFVLGDDAFRRYALDLSSRSVAPAPQGEDAIYASVESARDEEFPAELYPDKVTLDSKTVRKVIGAASLTLGDAPRSIRLRRAGAAG